MAIKTVLSGTLSGTVHQSGILHLFEPFIAGIIYHCNRAVPDMNQIVLIIYSLLVLIWRFWEVISIRRSVLHIEQLHQDPLSANERTHL